MAKVSVIVPVYNVEKYLHCCVDSILAQSFTDLELLLIDDGSKDKSASICDEYASKDSRVRVFHKENGGSSSARNIGLDNAHGEWIMFVDGDDWIDSNMLEIYLQEAEIHDAEVVLGDYKFVYLDSINIFKLPNWTENKILSLNNYITSVWTCLAGSIVKQRLYEEYQLYCPQNITYCEDFHLMVRLCFFSEKVIHVNLPFYNYRQQQMSIMHNLNKKTERDELWVYQDIASFLKEQGVYENYKQSMCWRILKATQELVLQRESWHDFLEVEPEKKRYVWNCPYINLKLKLNMYCLTHHLAIVSLCLLFVRSLKSFVLDLLEK